MMMASVTRAWGTRTSRTRGEEGGGTRRRGGGNARETKWKRTRGERGGPRAGVRGTWTVGWALRDGEDTMASMTMVILVVVQKHQHGIAA